jgi:hypothetical protein
MVNCIEKIIGSAVGRFFRPNGLSQPLQQGSNFIAAIAIEGKQNAMDHCGNFFFFFAIFILFTVHYYFDT